ncbi:surface lipoprotein assembly modifier [Poseidonocella sedimentorum]|uniref:Tetratricopeptide repeat-containing protein n=1 Tax=Poseidonocella sedimentorum TaxID=871652 RepID=A0A1I6DPV8_9RHOB|nr:surface lipoprotein assembly modifier [Poseidonocella sedimentorum]SFR07474.1 Tetratricopeptide repeat-containing protein [Poseidonocella sedimentorum]
MAYSFGIRHLAGAIFAALCFAMPAAEAAPVSDSDLSRLINTGQIETARARLEASGGDALDVLFLEGRIAKARGALDTASAAFREVLRAAPNRINARRELAHTLLMEGKYAAAERQFAMLLAEDDNPRMRAGYRRFLAELSARRPLRLTGHVALAPSSNINRGTLRGRMETDLGDFEIAEGSQARSGVGLSYGISGRLQPPGAAGRGPILRWSLGQTRYSETTFDRSTGQLSFGYEARGARGHWQLQLYTRREARNDGASVTARGMHLALGRQVSPRDLVGVTLSREWRAYDEQSYRDGPVSRLALSWEHLFTPRLRGRAGLSFTLAEPEAAHQAYHARSLSLDVERRWDSGLALGAGAEIGRRDFDADYPLLSSPRADRFSSLRLTASHSRVTAFGLRPQLRCSHLRSRSNVAFAEYSVNECQISLGWEF